MIFYLKSLSSQFSPGISETNLHLATVMTDDVSQEDRDAMFVSLLGIIGSRNQYARLKSRQSVLGKGQLVLMSDDMMNSFDQIISLSPWLLKGPPETWRSQLEEYNRKDPVFALIGGITKGEWKPIHQFSEDNHIPCLFPNTDFPVISRTDWYTLYLSKGYYQEGEAAAHYLNNKGELLKGGPIVQIVRDSREGRALSMGFQETWRDLGHEASVTHILKPGEKLTKVSATAAGKGEAWSCCPLGWLRGAVGAGNAGNGQEQAGDGFRFFELSRQGSVVAERTGPRLHLRNVSFQIAAVAQGYDQSL